MSASAIIFGCAGTSLSADELALFAEVQPWGFIVFARNLKTEAQVKNLTDALRQSVRHVPHIFIDEEGGRVSRLRTLGGWIGPPAADFLTCGAADMAMCHAAIFANYRAIGARLADLGFTADCAPVLDVPIADADPIIGDRAFARSAKAIAPLAQSALDGLHDAGVLGVIKHIPGHGRADVDSHLSLPLVKTAHRELSKTDFVPFTAMNQAKMAMSAHVIYADIDPNYPATTSKLVIEKIIRGEMGFDGLLMSDDLEMKALTGNLAQRGKDALAAGCDVLLHCSGDFAAMVELAAIAPVLSGDALRRARAATVVPKRKPLCTKTMIAQAKESLQALRGGGATG